MSVLGEWPIERVVSAVPDARHHVRSLIEHAIGYGGLVGDVELMAGELLSNAVDHGGGDKAHILVSADAGAIRVEVRDAGTKALPESHRPALMGERGRGLLIVAAFATTWGIHHDATGTTAWFEVRSS